MPPKKKSKSKSKKKKGAAGRQSGSTKIKNGAGKLKP